MNARWFPAKGHRAVIVMPQWNADAVSQNALCRIFNVLGISALRMSMPYHDIRRPHELTRADYAVSANIGRTMIRRDRALSTSARASTGCNSAATRDLAWSAPASARATPSSLRRTIRASA